MSLSQEQLNLQQELINQAEDWVRQVENLSENIKSVWYKLVGYIREYYCMNELWNGKELTFCANGELLLKIVISFGIVSVHLFDYDNKNSIIELTELSSVDETIQMINLKLSANRALPVEAAIIAPCGSRCDLCLFYTGNIDKHDRRDFLSLGFAKVYGDNVDFTTSKCGGCFPRRTEPLLDEKCKCANCAEEKGVTWCPSCAKIKNCPDFKTGIIEIGAAIPGLSADEVTHILLPYWTKSRIKGESK